VSSTSRKNATASKKWEEAGNLEDESLTDLGGGEGGGGSGMSCKKQLGGTFDHGSSNLWGYRGHGKGKNF